MRYRVQIVQQGRVLHEGEYDFAAEGDAERAITDAMSQARKLTPGPLWDIQVDVRSIQPATSGTP